MQWVANERAEERKRLELEHDEAMQKLRDDFREEKGELVRLHEVAKVEAVRDAEVATVQQYKGSVAFHKILAFCMTKAVIAIRKKVHPSNPSMRWNTVNMIRHVQRWLSEKRLLDPDSELGVDEERDVNGAGEDGRVVID
ncbi:unnamed protein product [Linum trigynum]|uniref:Uncharacterized protein n=1 Tax=Linum trigynum TaxID=586398 RepID=A0AAV2CCI9_9ROSI